MAITLVGKALAEEGKEFFYLGPTEGCEDCKLRNVCFNLDVGYRYKVTEVREQEHECHMLGDEKVTAVVVEKIPTEACLAKKGLLEGVTVTYTEVKCDNVCCPNYPYCYPAGKRAGDKFTVLRIQGDVECLKGDKRARVIIV